MESELWPHSGEPVTLFADGGELTATRMTGRFAYGRWQVTDNPEVRQADYPKELDMPLAANASKADKDKRLRLQEKWAENLDDAYIVEDLQRDEASFGRFEFGFVRADVSMNEGTFVPYYLSHNVNGHEPLKSDNPGDGEWIAFGNTETQFKTAFHRSDGQLFFQQQIGAAGIGRFRPGFDFNVGDLVDVSIWGTVVRVPVTGVTATVDGWQVAVGGELVWDADALRSRNSEILNAIKSERIGIWRERKRTLEQQNANRQLLTRVDQSEVKLTTKVNQVDSKVSSWESSVNADLARIDAKLPEVDEARRRADEAAGKANRAAREMGRFLWCDRDKDAEDNYLGIKMPRNNNLLGVFFKGAWRGPILVQVAYHNGSIWQRGNYNSGQGNVWITVDLSFGGVASATVFYHAE